MEYEKSKLEEILNYSEEDRKKFIDSLSEPDLDRFIDDCKKYKANQKDEIKYLNSLNNYKKGYDDTEGRN